MPWLGKAWQPWIQQLRHSRNIGLDVRVNNIRSIEGLAGILRTAYGPHGLSKIILPPPPQRPKITSDGMSILQQLDLLHPTVKLVREVGGSQAEQVGDGVITVLVLAFELLNKAKKLSEMRLHPTIIVSGYMAALRYALNITRKISIPVSWKDPDAMFKVALTAAGTKAAGIDKVKLARCAAEALPYVTDIRGSTSIPEKRRICVLKKVGSSTRETRLVRGMVFDRPLRHPGMPKRIRDARIAILKCGLEIKKWYDRGFKPSFRINVRRPESLRQFYQERGKLAKEQVDAVVKSGANVVVTMDRCDDEQASLLARSGVQMITGVADEGGIGRLAYATGGKMVASLDELEPDGLGYAAVAEEIQVGDGKLFVVDDCKDPRAVTILITGAVESILDESERALDSALAVCSDLVRDPRIVGGAGSLETELARRVRKYAFTIQGKQQMAVLAFADSLENMIKSLTENSGLDPIDSLQKLKAAHAKKDGLWKGIDLSSGNACDALEAGIVEPAFVKEHALKSAAEVACQIIRIDEKLVAKQSPKYMPGEIPGIGQLSLGEKAITPSFGPEDLPDETKKAIKKGRYVKIPGSRFGTDIF